MNNSNNTAPSSDASCSALLRTEMVQAAKQFLGNPRVRQTPLDERKQFLRGKGLTEAEIDAALHQLGQLASGPGSSTASELVPSASSSHIAAPFLAAPSAPPGPAPRTVVDLARSALVFGTAGYMVYRFVRSWLLPQLLNVPDPAEERMHRLEEQVQRLSESSRCIAESVAQTLTTVTEQNEQISRTLMAVQGNVHGKNSDMERVHSELGIVKSLLLNQNQFPPVPESALMQSRQNGGRAASQQQRVSIPAWQLGNGKMHAKGKRREGPQSGGEEANDEEKQLDGSEGNSNGTMLNTSAHSDGSSV